MTDETSGPVHVHVVRGAPDHVELAALVAGLAAVQVTEDAGADGPVGPRSVWTDRSRTMRGRAGGAAPGPDAWRWSLRG